MTVLPRFFYALLALLLAAPTGAEAQNYTNQAIGNERAPVVIDEYISLTCPHCADFYLNTLPKLEERYVKPGKVKIIMHDFPLDGLSLKAAALAHCMPPDSYFPFIQILYDNQTKWVTASNPDKILVQYARLGGLDEERAKSCLTDNAMLNAVTADRTAGEQTYNVSSTPTFVFNKGAETIAGASDLNGFTTVIDRMLARKK